MLRQKDKQAQIVNLREIYADITDCEELEQEKERLEGERDGVCEQYQKEIEQNARGAQDQGEYQKRADELAAEYNRLDAEVKAVEAEIQKRQLCGRRIETLVAALEIAREDFTVSLSEPAHFFRPLKRKTWRRNGNFLPDWNCRSVIFGRCIRWIR